MFDMGGGLLQIAANTVDNLQKFVINERQNSMNRKHEWAMWNAQNEYNLPVNQMQRLRDANLNPNLVYGNGATTLAAPFHSSPGRAADVGGNADAVARMRQQDAMTQQIEAQKDHLKAQDGQISQQISLIKEQTREAQARANLAEHNFDLVDGTDYILGENGLSQLRRRLSGNNKGDHETASVVFKKDKKYKKNQTVIFDPDLPAFGSNVYQYPENFNLRMWPW